MRELIVDFIISCAHLKFRSTLLSIYIFILHQDSHVWLLIALLIRVLLCLGLCMELLSYILGFICPDDTCYENLSITAFKPRTAL